MRRTRAPSTRIVPVWAYAEPRLRAVRKLMMRVAPRLDPVALVAILWLLGYLCFAVTSGRQPNGHSSLSDFWLMPTGIAIGLIAVLLVWDARLTARDQMPWRLVVVAGLTMPVADAFWLAADPPLAMISGEIAAIANLIPLILLGAAVLLFRPARNARTRPRSQYVLDLVGVVIVAGLTLWYLVGETVPASSGTDVMAWATFGGPALLAIAILSRIALRPTEGLSPGAATVLVLGGATAIIGAVLTSGPGPVTDGAATIGQISLALFRCALIVGARLELRARDKHQNLMREHGPSPLFYASIAAGSVQLVLLVIDLGEHYLVVAASCLALCVIIVIRQIYTVRDAVQADKTRRKTEA
ncbi:MAG TPA: hypothetical protein VF375_02135, partial [Candidatus Limnocylindrales bacterium]